MEHCNFFLLRYVPDAVKNEFVNIGLVLLPLSGEAELRFTRDWSRVRCLDSQADLEVLEALEADLRGQLRHLNGDRDSLLRRIQDSFSNALQPSEFKACLADSPAAEADALARLYLERPRRRTVREPAGRNAIFQRMRSEFESTGAWPTMNKNIKASGYTRSGDPLEIDCGYVPRVGPTDTVKMFHAVSLLSDANSAKVLAFTFPRMAEGLRRREGKQAQLTAVIEADQPRSNDTEEGDAVSFALETLKQQQIAVAPLSQMPQIAKTAARELGLM